MAAAAVAAGVVLTACSSPMEAGAAAIVGNERISASELNDSVSELRSALERAKIPEAQLQLPATQRVLLQLTSLSQFRQFAAKSGVTVTDGEIDKAITEQGGMQRIEPALLAEGVPPSRIRDWMGAVVAYNKLLTQYGGQNEAAQQKLGQALSSVKVTYSPRYGKFDPSQGFVDAGRFTKAASQQQQG